MIKDDREFSRAFKAEALRIVVPARPRGGNRGPSGWNLPALLMSAAVVVAALALGQALGELRSPSPAATAGPGPSAPLPTASASPEPTVSPTAQTTASHASAALGYSVQLPVGFRRSDCLSLSHTDVFTILTHDQESSAGLAHVGGGGTVVQWTLRIRARDDGVTPVAALDEVRGSVLAARGDEVVEPLVIDGKDAARLIVDGEPLLFAVTSEGRTYILELHYNPFPFRPRPVALPKGILEEVARSLSVMSVGPVPSPTAPTTSVPLGAQESAGRLADALGAGNADRLAPLLNPRCWLHQEAPESGPSGLPVGDVLSTLRARFADGSLQVRVDPAVQVATADGPMGLRLFVRSEWVQEGSPRSLDLYLIEVNGQWYWGGVAGLLPR